MFGGEGTPLGGNDTGVLGEFLSAWAKINRRWTLSAPNVIHGHDLTIKSCTHSGM